MHQNYPWTLLTHHKASWTQITTEYKMLRNTKHNIRGIWVDEGRAQFTAMNSADREANYYFRVTIYQFDGFKDHEIPWEKKIPGNKTISFVCIGLTMQLWCPVLELKEW